MCFIANLVSVSFTFGSVSFAFSFRNLSIGVICVFSTGMGESVDSHSVCPSHSLSSCMSFSQSGYLFNRKHESVFF